MPENIVQTQLFYLKMINKLENMAAQTALFRTQISCRKYTYGSRNGFGIVYVILRTVVARG